MAPGLGEKKKNSEFKPDKVNLKMWTCMTSCSCEVLGLIHNIKIIYGDEGQSSFIHFQLIHAKLKKYSGDIIQYYTHRHTHAYIHTHTHTHTHTYIYIYLYIYFINIYMYMHIYIRVCARARVCVCTLVFCVSRVMVCYLENGHGDPISNQDETNIKLLEKKTILPMYMGK